MLIDEIVCFCHRELQSTHCEDCQNNDFCGNNCKNCLDDLHYHTNHIRDDYDCERLLDFYVCRYSYKYCSEMMYALESVDLSAYPYFHILSLGCGGAADLMAFDCMNFPQALSYIGFDKNPYWEKIHNEIEERFTSGKAQFFRDIDVLEAFEKMSVPECNILSIEYLISFFYNTVGERGMECWFRQLVSRIIEHKPADSPLLVIINDVDSINTGRDTFLLLKRIIEESGLRVSFERRMRFKETSYFQNSIKHNSRQNKFELPQFIKDNYYPAINCESAQLILEVS